MHSPTQTAPPPISALVAEQRRFFQTGATLDVPFRIRELKRLRELIERHEADFLDALHQDLGKSAAEGYLTEIGFVLAEVEQAIKMTARWAKGRRVGTPLFHALGHSHIHPEPLGTVLILSTWNYPFQMLAAPLVGALAAGNTAVLKPSEFAPQTSTLFARLMGQHFDPQLVRVVEGGPDVAQALLEEKWDHIFFTGSTAIGRLVYQAAARQLAPVTLELGGKSPCIVDRDIPLDIAARRIAFGKFINAGQTCIAPDYLLVHEDVKAALVEKLVEKIESFYGSDASQSPDYGRIVSERHFDRLLRLMDSGRLRYGGQHDRQARYIQPTLLEGVSRTDAVMQEEIFGPILPILSYRQLDEAIAFVNAGEKPLALYLFSQDEAAIAEVLRRCPSGGAAINDTLMHIANPNLPFGGVGASGFGAYHGEASFRTFSHEKSVLHKRFLPDLDIRYAPWTANLGKLKALLRWFG